MQSESQSLLNRITLNISASYFAHQNDVNVLIKGVRLCLRIARSRPLFNRLNLRSDNTDKDDVFWLGDADPDKGTRCHIYLLRQRLIAERSSSHRR